MFRDDRLRVVLGGPGCGKTSRLLALVEQEITRGTSPQDIAFVTFTRAAAEEAKGRAARAFHLNPKDDLPWFRTIHSLAHSVLGISSGELMDAEAWDEFTALTQHRFGEGERGTRMLRVVEYAAATGLSLADAAHRVTHRGIEFPSLARFAAQLTSFQLDTGRMMYTDMLTEYLSAGTTLPVRVAFVDEGQDLTAIQWRVVEQAFRDAERVYVGGDDDQAIYRWAGADVDHFLGLAGTQEILPHSHRLPTAVYEVATRVSRRIAHRFPKPFLPVARAGKVASRSYLSRIDLSEGTWMLLARNGYALRGFTDECHAAGYAYRNRAGLSVNPEHWAGITLWEGLRAQRVLTVTPGEIRLLAKLLHVPVPALRETETYSPGELPLWPWGQGWAEALRAIPGAKQHYYNACLRRGEPMTTPRILIDTIHGVKGGEADNIVLSPDMARATWDGYARGGVEAEDEARVWYVGVTRARENLYVLEPRSRWFFPLGSLLFR